MSNHLTSRRNLLVLAACVSVVQVAIYYLAASTIRADGTLAIAQPDTLLYCQAARRIVEGCPFSFSTGTAVSTGTTTVLYPFLLAIFYFVGFAGNALLSIGFLLNAIFYVFFVMAWGGIACRVFAERPVARGVSVALLASFGPFAYCALAQSDIGLWMAVSAGLAYGLFANRKGIYVPLLLLAPWVRPEGMIVVFAYGLFCAIKFLRNRRFSAELIFAVLAVISVGGVFALNCALTGVPQFSSVVNKGHFTNLSFASAIYASGIDAMKIAKSYLLGIPQDAPRDFFYLPLVGAIFLWVGVFSRTWQGVSWRELAWYLAMLGGFVTVATSGWQNTNLDRYLVWTMPVLLLYMASGSEVVAARLGRCSIAKVLPGVALVMFSAAMAFVFVALFRFSSAGADVSRNVAARCAMEMPKGASVGTWGSVGIAYELPQRRVAHLTGIYSPEFLGSRAIAGKFEILKNEPETRFDYWFCQTSDKVSHYCGKPEIVAGETVLSSPPGFELRKADWSAYDAAMIVPKSPTPGLKLTARLDVAYEKDEKAFGYEPLPRDDYPLFAPFHIVGKLNGTNIVEGGRFLLGGDAMTVPLQPGRDVHVIMRTALKCTAVVERELGVPRSDFTLKSPMTLKVLVDGEDAGDVSFPVADGDVADATFVIPGRFVTTSMPRLAFLGEHVAFGYWFYQ